MRRTVTGVCEKCNRAFDLTNLLVRLTDTGAICPHCGQPTGADADDLARARVERATLPPLKPDPPQYPGGGGRRPRA